MATRISSSDGEVEHDLAGRIRTIGEAFGELHTRPEGEIADELLEHVVEERDVLLGQIRCAFEEEGGQTLSGTPALRGVAGGEGAIEIGQDSGVDGHGREALLRESTIRRDG